MTNALPIAEYTSTEDGTKSSIYQHDRGFTVTLTDVDSGEIFPASISCKSEERAHQEAKKIAGPGAQCACWFCGNTMTVRGASNERECCDECRKGVQWRECADCGERFIPGVGKNHVVRCLDCAPATLAA